MSDPTSRMSVVVASLVLTSLETPEVDVDVPVVSTSLPLPVGEVTSAVVLVDAGPVELVEVDVVKAATSPWHAHASQRRGSAKCRSIIWAATIPQPPRTVDPATCGPHHDRRRSCAAGGIPVDAKGPAISSRRRVNESTRHRGVEEFGDVVSEPASDQADAQLMTGAPVHVVVPSEREEIER